MTIGPVSHTRHAIAWHDDAACAGHPDPDVFFDDRGADGMARAKEIKDVIGQYCLPCPVRDRCLADTLAQARLDRYGVAGGVYWRGPAEPSDPLRVLPPNISRPVGAW